MDLLQEGVDRSTIVLWLGHQHEATTQTYLHATLAMREKALATLAPRNSKPSRYRPDDRLLLAFLKNL